MMERDRLVDALAMLDAARWTRTHDPSLAFLGELIRILGLLDVEVSDGDLTIA